MFMSWNLYFANLETNRNDVLANLRFQTAFWPAISAASVFASSGDF